MGFFKFFGNENKSKYTKKKSDGTKEGLLNILNPKKAADNYYNEPKKKKSSHHPRKKGNRKKNH
tara:strand:+ start:1161 stop:1352 length:192 start_codon:yes stop_codon:yes gene_type:complete